MGWYNTTAPRLVNPYKGLSSFGEALNRIGQQQEDNKYRNKVFTHNVSTDKRDYKNKVAQQGITNDLNAKKFQETKNQNKVKNKQWSDTFAFNKNNANKNYNLNAKRFNLAQSQANKPEYSLVQTVGSDGKPVYTQYDKNSGKFTATNQNPYIPKKDLTLAQLSLIQDREDRAELRKQKAQSDLSNKFFQIASDLDNWKKLSPAQQRAMQEEYIRTGGMYIPQIQSRGYWGFKNYEPIFPQNIQNVKPTKTTQKPQKEETKKPQKKAKTYNDIYNQTMLDLKAL